MAIMGPSGSGKSTLLADLRREYLGFVFQSFQLISCLTIIENVMLPLAVSSLSRAEKRKMATEIIDTVGLRSRALRLPGELSGGEQQRVAIARALVNQPPIVLADEPTGNLDSATSQEIMGLLASLNAEGHTIVLATHNPENLKYVHRCIRLRDGRVFGEDFALPTHGATPSAAERSSNHAC